MSRALVISVRFHDGRYHGETGRGTGEWPPGPARLFQALIAGVARGAELADEDTAALEWLETLDAPMIVVPVVRSVQPFSNYVPNNDLDKFGGDPRKIDKIRTPKTIRPHTFDAEIPLLFIWMFNGDRAGEDYAQSVCKIAEHLYQLGRGVDMAWAWAQLLDADEVEARVAGHGGIVHRPTNGGAGKALFCPQRGSRASL